MKQYWYRWVLVVVVGVALVVSGYLGYQRHLLEQENDTVEIAVVYDEMRELAAGQGMATGELLELLRERGVTSVLVKEPVADESRRLGELAVMKGREIGRASCRERV